MSKLLDEMFDDEVDPDGLAIRLLEAIELARDTEVPNYKELFTNHFNIYFYYDRDEVRIEDDIDPSDAGEIMLTFEQLRRYIVNRRNTS